MKNFNPFLIILIVFGFISFSSTSGDKGKKAAEKLGWELGFQAYTFRNFSFEEALNIANELGLKNIEAYSKHKIRTGKDEITHFSMESDSRKKLMALLKDKGIALVAYGVIKGKNEEEWEQIFEYAKNMGAKTITTSPDANDLDLVEKLCEKYEINAAIHNHPIPSLYWHPDSVLNAVEGRSPRMGACPDIGHWMRSGLDPVECLQKLEGRIIMLHLKDINELDRKAHDVPWGTGVGDIPAMLTELKRQGYQGPIHIEYEHNPENPVPDVEVCIRNFYRMVAAL